ncbi:MAG TPA: Holliday junction branch migration protein RuvA [Caulobacteraceae bacterium]|nr:Holliday junction branch migration protein RuvA [Caulobacteraceae bacterium]
MIGRLRGIVLEVGPEEATVEVAGVGYVVRCGARTLARLDVGDQTVLHIETQWSEATGPRLYGFLDRPERHAFAALQAIQGVGPKAALGVLDVLSPAELAAAAARGDRALIGRAQGVGPKLAARIAAELKERPIGPGLANGATAEAPALQDGAWGEALAALTGLGCADLAARRAVDQAMLRVGREVELPLLIKAALRELDR